MNVKIGKRIKALRNHASITQERLAEAIGVTAQAISKWENEIGYPDIDYIVPIANFFNVTIDELFEHDKQENESKIVEYCERFDEMHRNERFDEMYHSWENVRIRIDLMRRALAEFPANERLLVRLASALREKWNADTAIMGHYSRIGDQLVYDFDKVRACEGWEEPAQIMEQLLATTVDEKIRSECRNMLIRLYGDIGDRENVYRLADYCPDCKASQLFAAFSGKYEQEARENSQQLLIGGFSRLCVHMPSQTDDPLIRAKVYEKLIDLYELIFDDGNYGFYHAKIELLFLYYAEVLLNQNRIEEVFAALEKAYEHAKGFDAYLDQLRENGKMDYTSTFTDCLRDDDKEVYATKALPELLHNVLLDANDHYYPRLRDDPRFLDLTRRIQDDLGE